MAKKKLLFVINSLVGGGAERVFSNLVNYVGSTQTYDVKVLLLDKEVEQFTIDSVDVVRLQSVNNFVKLIEFIKFIRIERPDVVVSFLTRSNLFNIIGKAFLGYRAVTSERGMPSFRLRGGLSFIKKCILRSFYRFSDDVICVSEGVKEDLAQNFGVNKDKLSVIYNPISAERITHLSQKESVKSHYDFIAIGRLKPVKGFDTLIKAFSHAKINATLAILGDGPERERLQKLIDFENLTNKVLLIGHKQNPYPYISSSNCFVLSSQSEGFPNVLVESMALGKHVISTNCQSGPGEILEFSKRIPKNSFLTCEYGAVVNVGDISGLANALLHMYKTKDINTQSVRRVAIFNESFIYKQWERVFEK